MLLENGDVESPAHVSLEFRVFLVNAQTGKHTQEARTLRFWFKPSLVESERATVAAEFFRELVSRQDFPRGKFFKVLPIKCKLGRLNCINFFRLCGFYQKNNETHTTQI